MKRVLLAVCVAALVCAAVAGYVLSGRRSLMRQLVRHTPERTFAARLSISTDYRACDTLPADSGETVPRERCGAGGGAPWNLREFADAGESTDPDALRASGLAAIIWPNRTNQQALGDAILRLEKALRLSRRRAPLLVDLAAAHLVRAEREQEPRDLLAAIDYADEALALEPRNLAARYNSALAMQAFGLDEEAEEAWDAYLVIDSTSPWAEEAHRRKRDLITYPREILRPAAGASAEEVAKFAEDYPQEAREYALEEVLKDWGVAVAEADSPRAAALLDLAEGLGRALEKLPGGDGSLADAVAAIRAARGDAAATMTLARAHRDYAVGKAYFDAVEVDSAKEALARVSDANPPSPVLLQWTATFQAGTRSLLGQRDQAIADLRSILAHVDRSRDPALAGQAQLILGTLLFRASDYAVAREQLKGAAGHLRNAGETKLFGAALSMEGEAAYEEGDTVAAYQLLHQAQGELRSYRDSKRLHDNLHGLARCAVLSGMPKAALAIYDEDLRVVRREGTPARVLDVLQARGRARSFLGDSIGAEQDLDSAVALVATLPDDDVQEGWARAVLKVANPRGVPVAQMDSAVESFANYTIWVVPALLRRADALLKEGDLRGATRDLEAVTRGVHGLSRQQANRALRGATLEQARDRFDRLVMLYLHMGRPVEALSALERGRLSFTPQRDSAAPVGAGRFSVPAGQVALEYALIGDTLLAWAIRGDTLRLVSQRVDREAFVLAVEQVGAAFESPDAPLPTEALRRLYDLLIRPVRGYLGPTGTSLVILADGEVAGVPFAALTDGNRYLIEDHPLRFAPTLADAAREAPPRSRRGPALLVADPAFDAGEHPLLFRLDSARAEVDGLLGFYPDRVLLGGDAATRDTFVQSAPSASVIHYAGHAVFDDARPERSFLVLAGADTTGRLTAEAVSALNLRGVRLVVLSACRTLRSRQGRSGGFAGLSGALLTAEAGGVVGSLWQVSDELTAPLMREFHAEFQTKSRDPASALRNAQLAMLNSKGDPRLNSPAVWAGFRYTGESRP